MFCRIHRSEVETENDLDTQTYLSFEWMGRMSSTPEISTTAVCQEKVTKIHMNLPDWERHTFCGLLIRIILNQPKYKPMDTKSGDGSAVDLWQ